MAVAQKNDVKRIYNKLSLGPELRTEPAKGAYPKGRFKQVFDVFSAEMNSLMRVNLLFLLFLLPLLAVVVWYAELVVAQTVVNFNFMGNIGVGFPGGSDDATQGLIAIYKAYQNILYMIVPAMVVMSLGVAGSFNCYKKYMWGEKVSIGKDFFRGIRKYWYKYILVLAIDALLVLAEGSLVIYFMTARAMGTATAGIWVLLIGVSLAIFLISYINVLLLPMICSIDLSFLKQIKNSILLSIKFAIIGLPIWLVSLLPIGLLFLTSNFVSVLLYMTMLMFGIILYGLGFTAFGHYTFDTVLTPLYIESIAPKNPAKKKKKKNKKSGGR